MEFALQFEDNFDTQSIFWGDIQIHLPCTPMHILFFEAIELKGY